MARSLIQAHERVKTLDWEPSLVERRPPYQTRYHIPKKTKDPFRTLVREYLTMEQEKDDRQYGGFEDVLSRTARSGDADTGWLDGLKLALPIVVYAEYGAEKCQSMLVDTVDNAELRAGYLAQAMDLSLKTPVIRPFLPANRSISSPAYYPLVQFKQFNAADAPSSARPPGRSCR